MNPISSAIKPTPKTETEVQRAHDLILSMLFLGQELDLDPEDGAAVLTSATVLCWVLGHRHNPAFALDLQRWEDMLTSRGFLLTDSTLHRLPRGPAQ
jgi:hypothetical protein